MVRPPRVGKGSLVQPQKVLQGAELLQQKGEGGTPPHLVVEGVTLLEKGNLVLLVGDVRLLGRNDGLLLGDAVLQERHDDGADEGEKGDEGSSDVCPGGGGY